MVELIRNLDLHLDNSTNARACGWDDLEQSDVIVLIASDLCATHPKLWERVLRNCYLPHIVVIDTEPSETAALANTYIGLAPQSELYLFSGLACLLIENGWIDREFFSDTTDFDTYAAHIRSFTPSVVTAQTGISMDTLQNLAHTIHHGERVSFWWTPRGNQTDAGVAQAINNLALMTGNTHRSGAGSYFFTSPYETTLSRSLSSTIHKKTATQRAAVRFAS